jgi:8-oxo-dGTP pyrophosphatase MutT (NUDIX family)
MYVFPGGRLDGIDSGPAIEAMCDDLSDARASELLQIPHGGLAYWVAAIRECFEEAGVLLARSVHTGHEIRFDEPVIETRFNAARQQIHDGTLDLIELCRAEGLRLMTDCIHYTAHWVTPVGESRRFDTRFFVARAPHAQEPLHDDSETIASLWVRPGHALQREQTGELLMLPPTIACLRFLEPHDSADAALAAAGTIGVPPRILPKVKRAEPGSRIEVVLPGEAGYDELS